THVTGTMVGDDGGENQIGVAPGATWIAANGCCPSDAALISSGQWMLAPTKLDGSDADPTKAPDIINSSWGTQSPSNEPFMEDIIEDWHTAGIFGVFANGNSGSWAATRPDRRAAGSSRTRSATTTRATVCPRPRAVATARTARSSRTSPLRAAPCAPRFPGTDMRATPAPRWPAPMSRARSHCCGLRHPA